MLTVALKTKGWHTRWPLHHQEKCGRLNKKKQQMTKTKLNKNTRLSHCKDSAPCRGEKTTIFLSQKVLNEYFEQKHEIQNNSRESWTNSWGTHHPINVLNLIKSL